MELHTDWEIGIRSVMRDLGLERKLKVKTDASVAKSISMRRGTGKIRHIEVNQLWLQERVSRGDVEIEKVRTGENLADLLTKHQNAEAISKHLKCTGVVIGGERSPKMPNLTSAGINLIEMIDCMQRN